LRLTPISFYMLWCSFNLGISATYVGYTTLDRVGLSLATHVVPPEDIAVAYVIFLCGVLPFHLGLELLRPLLQEKSVSSTSRPQVGIWLLALWVLGIVFRTRPAWFAFLGTIANPLQWASLAALSM